MMIATECPPADRLRALAHGRLSDEQSDLLFDHVRGCDVCRSELETLHDDGDSLIVTLRGGDGAAGLDAEAGFDEEPGCRVAVAKALGALARSADARMRERFDAEMRAIGRLSHPNVVSAFDAREVDGTAVLVTEYIDGFDLGELVARVGPLSVADGCEIGRRVAEALAYTSGEGFVHRDVKPSNVMLGRDGSVKLLDLGLARFQVDGVDSADSGAESDSLGGATSGGEAVGSDLGELVAEADRAEGGIRFEATEQKPSGSRQGDWWRRRVPVWGLVAAGLIGVVIGFACGITITIRTPDGSKMTMTVPDGSDIEIDSTGEGKATSGFPASPGVANAADRKTLVEHQERLQGVWQLVSLRIGGRTVDTDETLFIVDGTRLSTLHDGNRAESGVFSLTPDNRDSASRIRWALVSKRIEVVGFARFVDDEEVFLEFTEVQARSDAGFSAGGEGDHPMLYERAELERIGDVPRTEAELNLLSEGRPETIREA